MPFLAPQNTVSGPAVNEVPQNRHVEVFSASLIYVFNFQNLGCTVLCILLQTGRCRRHSFNVLDAKIAPAKSWRRKDAQNRPFAGLKARFPRTVLL
jgi:hypothetical protein